MRKKSSSSASGKTTSLTSLLKRLEPSMPKYTRSSMLWSWISWTCTSECLWKGRMRSASLKTARTTRQMESETRSYKDWPRLSSKSSAYWQVQPKQKTSKTSTSSRTHSSRQANYQHQSPKYKSPSSSLSYNTKRIHMHWPCWCSTLQLWIQTTTIRSTIFSRV